MSDYVPTTGSAVLSVLPPVEKEIQKRPVIRLGTPLVIPEGYGYVVMTGLASVILLTWKSMMVSSARKELQVPSPLIQSSECMRFNCVYRAHQSTVEMYPQFLFLLLVGGLEMPYFCAGGGLIWLLGRFIYAHGYYSDDPRNRTYGSFFMIGHLMLLIGALKFGWKRMST